MVLSALALAFCAAAGAPAAAGANSKRSDPAPCVLYTAHPPLTSPAAALPPPYTRVTPRCPRAVPALLS
ncbi:MAG TPA: hypothetical protein VK425_05765, partial [Acidimicrobiales bacterium]|nr:hypothetical protein [Acidimicrobiales bacterium]